MPSAAVCAAALEAHPTVVMLKASCRTPAQVMLKAAAPVRAVTDCCAAAAEAAAEKARLEQERLERLARLAELAQSSLDQAIAEESASYQEGSEEQVAQSFRMGIYQQILENF